MNSNDNNDGKKTQNKDVHGQHKPIWCPVQHRTKTWHSNKAESMIINSTDSLIPNTDDSSSLQYRDIIGYTKSQTMDLILSLKTDFGN